MFQLQRNVKKNFAFSRLNRSSAHWRGGGDCFSLSGKRNADIGAVFGITIQAVTNAVRGVEKRREGDRRFNSELMRIKEIVGGVKQSV